ncbi:Autophagy-related protein [Actinidia chinensis var. chinensis]|uniref:Autophagy-related protein n=1 Tax=Actinidia chinensis var. chinensis TaxID=1590841 RepID=A0A2R6QIB8_ACTCC|nr:Autophagy-related protein [Actinidia chinensis var. chinensis]
MSSSVSEGVVHRGKLLVHIAENGHSFELECDEFTLVEAVQRSVESVSGIQLNDQLLLCLDMKLDSQRPLSAYKLPSDDREVFLFNRARMRSNSMPPASEQIEIVEIPDPPAPSSSHNPHPLDDASDPALKALPSYARQFRYHYQYGYAIYSRTQVKVETCEKLLGEQKVQERALEIARGNLDHFYKMIHQNYMDFTKCYSQQYRSHSNLLVNFGRDIEKLRSCKLLPALQTSTRKYLLDFVKEENLRKLTEDCSSSHRQFENKVSEFKQEFGELKRSTEQLFTSKASFLIRDLELTIKEQLRYVTEQKSIMQALSKDVNLVKKLVDDCLTTQLSSSLRPHDAVSALGPMYDGHDKNYLPKMQACDRAISNLLDFCKDKKNEMNIFVHNYMQKIAYIQYTIKDVRYKFSVFTEAMKRQNDQFEYLKVVRGIGPAYRACLAEVVRRKASMKLYMGVAGQLAEKLATKREAEVRRREEFLKIHSSFMPRDILASMGLNDTPSQCEVNIPPFDTKLLDIDIPDLDRYAPEHLVELSSKSDKHGSLKGSFSASNISSHSAEIEESVLDSPEKHEMEELLEVSELVEIAGTSKLEVENAKLKAELASAIAIICSFGLEVEYETLDDSKVDSMLKNAAEKTSEALHLKDEYGKHLQSMLKVKQMQCESYEKRIQELEQRLSDQYLQGHRLPDDKTVLNSALSTVKSGDSKSDISGDTEAHLPCLSSETMDEVSCASNSLHYKSGIFPKQSGKASEGLDENMTDSSSMMNPQLDSSMLELPRDEVSCASNSLHYKSGIFPKQSGKASEGLDENMTDSSSMMNPQLDSSMLELPRDEVQAEEKDGKDAIAADIGMALATSCTAESMSQHLNNLPAETTAEQGLDAKASSDLVMELQSAFADKSNQLSETETKLKALVEEAAKLERELDISRKLLDESQMNCAHLENCLHEARKEAQTHLCAADRRASEYNALRTSAVKMRSLFERLRSCVSSGGVAGFAESLRALAQSLANSASDSEDDGSAEFRECVRVLADKVGLLSRHRAELHERYSKAEATTEQLKKELEEKKELVNTLYIKHQHEKQANKEKISFGRLEVREIAAFVHNSAGHYEAINRNCPNYYLSAESVALFLDHLPNRPSYIIGLIVHIERQTVRLPPPTSVRAEPSREDRGDFPIPVAGPSRLSLNSGSTSNPYGLAVGCEYFVVTVAMLPETTIHSQPPS